MSDNVLVRCQDLSVGYERQAVVSGLNFEINPGDYLCVIGENGAGKTTLMKTLIGVIKPISGSLFLSPETKKSGIGYLPQQNNLQKDFPATVMEVVLSGFQHKMGFRPFYSKNERQIAMENLHKLGICKLAKRCFSELSGGQQQRVLLARAFCCTKEILLVDEPVSGLDPNATESMYQILEKTNKDGVAVVMITHDVTSAIRYASHVLLVDKESFFGTKEEFLQSGLEAAGKHFVGGHDHD